MPKYPYTLLPSDLGPIPKPWIKVQLNYRRTHKITLPVIALIDSGADVCFCTKAIGIWLGIPFSSKHRTTFTAANRTTFKTYKETVVLYACGKRYQCPFFFTEVLPKETPIILGQLGFFDHFRITFNAVKKEEKEVEIT